MKPFFVGSAGLAAILAMAASGAVAGTSGAIYDMDRFLHEPHPFARPPAPQARPVPRQAKPAAPQARPARPAPKRVTGTVKKRRPLPELEPEPESAPAPAPGEAGGLWGILSEARLGLLAHDEGPFSSNKEDGADINVELLFVSPDILDAIWSPRPHVGFSANTSGDTNQAYLGLTWEWKFWRRAFVDFSLGGAVHDGQLTTSRPGRTKKELGCRTLFRLSTDIGYNFSGPHSLMLHLGHISNASLCDRNEGLENAGVRYGYRF